ncbi:restriction endonuclease subunit S [Kitasatospora sp. NPDC057512]|uniref:restriction endonuclease subunit S n=1 Tax=Kitasatospora sp. NPDC057512 TaxID=3346154 RepID=UPI00369E8DC7
MREQMAFSEVDGWTRRSLGSISSRVVQRNGVNNRNVLTISARYGLVSQEQFFNRQVASVDLSQYFLLGRGDFAYNKSYSVGYPAGVVRRLDLYDAGVVSPLYICFRVDPEFADPAFVSHYFESGILNDAILSIAKEGVRNHGLLNVKVGDFFSLDLHLPEVDEQRDIAEILDSVDRRILNAQSVLVKHRSAAAELASDVLSQVAHRDIPLRECVRPDVPIGYGIVQAGPHVEDGVPYIRTGDMAGDQIDPSLLLRTTPEISESYARTRVVAGDLVVTIRATVGKVLPIPSELEGVNLTRGTARVAPSNGLAPGYLLWALRSRKAQAQFASAVKGTTFSEITLDQLRDLLVPVPDQRIHQEEIVRLMDASTRRSAAEQAVILKLQALKRALMDDLLTGRVRVPVSAKR